MCGAAGILSHGLLLPTLTSSSPPLTSAAVHDVLLMLPPNAGGQRMSSALPKSKAISELPTTTVILGKKGPPALVWTAGIFWPVQILGSDAKACAGLHGRSDSKEISEHESKLIIVSGLFDQCDQKGAAAWSWEGGRSCWRAVGVCHHLPTVLQEPRCHLPWNGQEEPAPGESQNKRCDADSKFC